MRPGTLPRWLLLCASLSLILAASSPQTTAADPKPAIEAFLDSFAGSVHRVKFPNGLRLLVVRRSNAPVVSCYIKFKAGSVDETERTAGIAHMLEHMLFKGTKSIGTKNYQKERKYIATINSIAASMDAERRKAEALGQAGKKDQAAGAAQRVALLRKRMDVISGLQRKYVIADQDSYIYGLHGQRNFNAYTNRDLTNYQVSLPANRLPIWARLEADRMQNSVLRDFYTERAVVAEERRMRVDNSARGLLFERFASAIYGEHPYGRPVIGPMRSIQYLNYEQAMAFYKTYYAPNNTVIALVGDVDPAEAEALVRKEFGGLKPRRLPKREIAAPKERSVSVELKMAGPPVLMLAWFKPTFPDKADLALSLLSTVLAGGEEGRLYRKLVIEKRIAASLNVYSDYPGERYQNLFLVYGLPAPGRTHEELQKAIMEELRQVIQHGIDPDELLRAKRRLLTGFVYGLRSNDQLADQLSYYESIFGDYRTVFEATKTVTSLTTKDLQTAAARFITDRPMVARLLPPEPAKQSPGKGAAQ